MDKIDKFLDRLPISYYKKALIIFKKIKNGDLHDLDVSRLSGFKDVFRVRFGKYRVIFMKSGDEITFISAGKRNDQTYGKL